MNDYFAISDEQLHIISEKIDEAIRLKKLPLLDSFLRVPSSTFNLESGTFLGVDFGGTFFKFSLFSFPLNANHLSFEDSRPSLQIPIPERLKKSSGSELFGFLAEKIIEFLKKQHEFNNCERPLKMGFTFSYPTRQSSLISGHLLKWAKDIDCQDAIGKDVVSLMQDELDSRQANIRICALLNDTVAAIMAYKHQNPKVTVGCIFGTGTNGAFISEDSFRPVNSEWGSFWDSCIPVTPVDVAVDEASLYPGEQRFEKLISARYLGEIAQKWLEAETGEKVHEFLDSKALATLASSESDPCNDRGQLLKNVAIGILGRAAKLGAAAIVAVARNAAKTERGRVYVTIDGSLYTRCEYFRQILGENVKRLSCGDCGKELEIHLLEATSLAAEASCLGAAVAVALIE